MDAVTKASDILTTLFIRLPLWLLQAIPPWNRPRPGWTLFRTVLLQYLKYSEASPFPAGLDAYDYTAIVGGRGIKGVWVPPTPHLVRGEVKAWANLADVECARILGYWYDKSGHDTPPGAIPAEGERVIYHLHGGAFARFSAHPSDTSSHGPRAILEHSRSIHRLFNLEYRRTKGPADAPTNPFPTALLDAIAGYNYLVTEVGFLPENIVVTGDSAGANLALALVRYLVEQRGQDDTAFPRPPGALGLVSPWVDLSVRGHEPSSSLYINRDADYVDTFTASWTLQAYQYCGALGWAGAEKNRYISPACELIPDEEISFAGFPRTIIIAGGAEVLRDQMRVLRSRMVKDLGDKDVDYHEFPGGFHNFMAIPGYGSERTQALDSVRDWLEPAQS
ncbi:alpha/beta hydrolase [Phanerochaete sordida]|uniref:Alpha/beta hydrolase n=1 Tax=Phanerochaete sordida TaxID=48140 RepID=A0A9P3GKY4_9APHY|nr:alpha/beta hydrolase [Phanerochaete sordida]